MTVLVTPSQDRKGRNDHKSLRAITTFLLRGSREHADFWTFFRRYEQFQSRHRTSQKHQHRHGKSEP